ncbi:asparaginase domain-containing protein [Marinifilum flexuosum]|uniref:L-asparaginase n=1 Tax=Marinifilum flexuosum TaxID=1117708 RepID=A0A419WSY1_9BACT|nr:asparaginase domain-containing protein [Marinifilum flexuosum]RKD98583.1 L-asparaginase [Marinifilum flexuosum]
MKLVFVQTGGTIDKDYPHTTKGWAFEFGEPATKRILEKLDPSFEFEVLTSCQKDSLEITEEDRQNLADLINHHEGDKFIVTHGTDTMGETADYLSKKVGDKLVVITGAMRPERFSNSEAPINLGCAIATANLMDKGIFIAMHGIVKEHSEMKRNLETGKYY